MNRARVRAVNVPVVGTAPFLIDVINDLHFEAPAGLVAQAEPIAVRLAVLKRRATAAGRRVSRRLQPTTRDYFVLKPKHSGLFDTTLDTLLAALRIRRVILTGIAGNICVLFTANDAYMRDLKILAPSDCIVSNTPEENGHALTQIGAVLKGNLTPSALLCFQKRRRRDAVQSR